MTHPTPTGPLARWYAEPLDREAAGALLARVARRDGCAHRLAALVARAALGEPVEGEYRLAARRCAASAHGRALCELVYGQLLAARRQPGGSDHLERGFRLAAALLAPRDYFRVSERHALLRWLPAPATPPTSPATTPAASPAVPLKALLTEAAVVQRLRTAIEPRTIIPDRSDTLG